MRRYLEHNAKVIHGVPRGSLLVVDLFRNPTWQPLADFLGVPVPDAPFPTPSTPLDM